MIYMTDQKTKPAPLAYQNEPFLNSPDGRILRLLSEYSEPLSRFRREQIQDTVEEVLLASPYKKSAKAYILYRDQHARIRDLERKRLLERRERTEPRARRPRAAHAREP